MLEDEIVFTKHANERLSQRKITREMVISTIEIPEKYFREGDGNTKFIRSINGRMLHVVCQPLEEERKWLVKTVWVRGEDNEGNVVPRRNRYDNSHNSGVFIFYWVAVLIMLGLLLLLLLYSIGNLRF